jgi:hypothetical protein
MINDTDKKTRLWLTVFFGLLLMVSFLMSFVSWQGNLIHGYDLAWGKFFDVSSNKFGLDNPLPQFSFAFYLFNFIPIGAILSIAWAMTGKRYNLIAFITGALSLSLVSVYFFFTQKLIMLGVPGNVFSMMRIGAWLHAIAALGLILSVTTSHALLKKIAWIAVGPVFVFVSFQLMENYLMNKTYSKTDDVKADYTVAAPALLQEFLANDSAANAKYREKIIEVKGVATEVLVQTDSTVNVRFVDSSGSYIIFPLGKDQYSQSKDLMAGDNVSVKGSCSGSVHSEILGTTAINFKRTILNKQ